MGSVHGSTSSPGDSPPPLEATAASLGEETAPLSPKAQPPTAKPNNTDVAQDAPTLALMCITTVRPLDPVPDVSDLFTPTGFALP